MFTEGRLYLDRAVSLIDSYTNTGHAARALRYAGSLWRDADRRRSLSLFERAAKIYREIGDAWNLGPVLGLIGGAHLYLGDYDEASKTLLDAERMISSVTDQSKALLNVFNDLGLVNSIKMRTADAEHYFGMAAYIARILNDKFRLSIININIGELDFKSGNIDGAAARNNQAYRGLLEADAPNMYLANPIINLASLDALRGNISRSRKSALKGLDLIVDTGGYWLRICLEILAFIMAHRGLWIDSCRVLGFVDQDFATGGEARQPLEQALHDRLWQTLRSALSPDSIEIWTSEGAYWSAGQAVACVREHLGTEQQPLQSNA